MSCHLNTVDLFSEQYFQVLLFIILYKLVLTFKSVDKTLVCDHSNGSYWSVLSSGAFYYTLQDFLALKSMCMLYKPCSVLPFIHWTQIAHKTPVVFFDLDKQSVYKAVRIQSWLALTLTGNRVTEWLIDNNNWVTEWLTDWLTDLASDWLHDQRTCRLTDWLISWADWLWHWHTICLNENGISHLSNKDRNLIRTKDYLKDFEFDTTSASTTRHRNADFMYNW